MNDILRFQGTPHQSLSIFVQDLEHPWRNIRGDKLLLAIDDLHRLNLELVLAVLREGPNEGIEAYVGLGSVEGSDLN